MKSAKSLYGIGHRLNQYNPTYRHSNVLLKFGVDIVATLISNIVESFYPQTEIIKFRDDFRNQTIVRVRKKKQYVYQAAYWNLTSLEINRILSIYTSNLLLTFGFDIHGQTKAGVQKPKNSTWPPDIQFESDIAQNQ